MNNTGVKISISVFALSLYLLPLMAQSQFEKRYLVSETDVEQGLTCSFVDDVMIDDTGFLWIATSGGGLCRHDGYGLLTFTGRHGSLLQEYQQISSKDSAET